MTITNALFLFCGLGLFLYGMTLMGDGLELSAGSSMKVLIGKLTSNRFFGLLVGCGITALIQSSSATTVMVVGFVNAKLMTLSQAVGVIMGANIGLGILFIGLDFMSEAMAPLKNEEWFTSLLIKFKNPFLGILAGTLITAVIQSSSASVGILQAFAMQGLVTLDGSVYIMLGMNIGTCITAIISCIKTSKNAKRAAVIHLLFNVIGTVILIPLIMFTPLLEWMKDLSPGNAVRQIANTNTVFKLISTLCLFPFGNGLIKLSKLIIRGEDEEEDYLSLKYVDDLILESPTVAVSSLLRELERMSSVARNNLDYSLACFCDNKKMSESETKKFTENEALLNYLNTELTRYLTKTSALELSQDDAFKITAFFRSIGDFERIGDHAENILEYSEICRENHLSFSTDAVDDLQTMRRRILTLLDDSLKEFFAKQRSDALESSILTQEEAIDELTEDYRNSHLNRLTLGICDPQSSMIFEDILNDLERVADHSVNIGCVYMEVKAI